MNISFLEKAILERRYKDLGSHAKIILQKPDFFKETILLANAHFIDTFFDKERESSLIKNLFCSRLEKSRFYYEDEVRQKIEEFGLTKDYTQARLLVPDISELKGMKKIPIFDNTIIGTYSKMIYYHFEVIKRGLAEDIYRAIRI